MSSKLTLRALILVVAVVALTVACKSGPRVTTAPPVEPVTDVRPVPTPVPEEVVTDPRAEAIPSEAVAEELPEDLQELNRRGFLEDVFFDTDRHDLRPEAREALVRNSAWLLQYPSVRILVEGHCDERNTREYNLALGERRAASVRDYLISLGVSPDRIRIVSYGEERPFALGHDESAWRLNRRAHFVITGR